MAVTAPVSLSKIHTEFGGTAAFSAYVRGGTYVPSHSGTNGISATASGLSFGQFSGASNTDLNIPLNWNNASGGITAVTNSQTIIADCNLTWSVTPTSGSPFITATRNGSGIFTGTDVFDGDAIIFTANVFSGAASGSVSVYSDGVFIDSWSFTLTG